MTGGWVGDIYAIPIRPFSQTDRLLEHNAGFKLSKGIMNNLSWLFIAVPLIFVLLALVINHFTVAVPMRKAGEKGIKRLGKCPLCDGKLEVGATHAIVFQRGLTFRPVAAVRCTECGHLEFFTNP